MYICSPYVPVKLVYIITSLVYWFVFFITKYMFIIWNINFLLNYIEVKLLAHDTQIMAVCVYW